MPLQKSRISMERAVANRHLGKLHEEFRLSSAHHHYCFQGDDGEEEGGGGGSSSLLSSEKQSFFLRLLERENSSSRTGSSSRHRLAPSLVPFLWESSPGLPDPTWLSVSSDDDHQHPQAETAPPQGYSTLDFDGVPPLSPPPTYMHLARFSSPRLSAQSCLPVKFSLPPHYLLLLLRPPHAAAASLSSRIKTTFRRHRRTVPANSRSMLLLGSSSPSTDNASHSKQGRSLGRPSAHTQGQLPGSDLDSEHFRGPPASSSSIAGNKETVYPQGKSSDSESSSHIRSQIHKRNASIYKMKGCSCFRISRREA
ncbi:hypothetical protein KP509_31G028400 [Ceratopteris richardii]|uniref:Uncharacterized protein n=1 Tax=Ceratopteris richardii TaxID=49495 RepID=A0A8T2QWW5_CERRI|nr:hypothetical protein KP509_31G028400 [Ceratopteris richardii]